MNQVHITPGYLNREQAAQYCGISPQAIDRYFKTCKYHLVEEQEDAGYKDEDGKYVNAAKVIRKRLYKREDLDQMMDLYKKVP